MTDTPVPLAKAVEPHRVQRSRARGWKMPPNTVYVGRPTSYGNPFVGEAAAAVDAYRAFLTGRCHVEVGPDRLIKRMEYIPAWNAPYEIKRMAQLYLRGKNLACWCPLDKPCHADVLLEIANR